jgi:hypothetical protein
MTTRKAAAAPYDPEQLPGRQPLPPSADVLLDDEGNELPTFDQRYAEPFKGLVYLGALQQPFEWLGHTFVIRTLTTDEKLAISLLLKPYVGTAGEQLAYSIAVAAMATVSVDGEELPIPIGDTSINALAEARFNYVRSRWYDMTTAKVFEQYLELEDLVAKVVDAMGKRSAPTASTPGSSGTSA